MLMIRNAMGIVWLTAVAFSFGCAPTKDDRSGAVDGGGDGDRADARPDNGGPDAAACATASRQADETLAPVDIIWVVDSSGSMDDETEAVQDALNDFSVFIDASGIDYRVILIGDASAMSVPAPLGGSAEFLHVDIGVASTDALEQIRDTYPVYQSFLRADALLHIVVVTDDESDWSHTKFNSEIAGLSAPGLRADYTLHSICSEETVIFTPPAPFPPVLGACSGGLGSGGAARPGKVYIDISSSTNGLWRSICTSDWNPIFMAVADAVSVGVALPCTFDVPAPPAGENLDPDRVNFVFQPSGGGASVTVPRVDGAGSCSASGGWYYDDPTSPTQIEACPVTCSILEGDEAGRVDIEFGCATVVL